MSMLEKMIASPGFANLRADLQNLRDQAKPLADQVQNLLKQAKVVVLDYTSISNHLQQLQAAFQQVNQLLHPGGRRENFGDLPKTRPGKRL